ncbi:BRO family, N-terminal domain [Seinonella peptonophila]|uniref:BRO family, N-terminal domain n=1 Tax=Seinonella peptonophila TaxID=112248 RepID=A0A1M5B3U9_9BACL|nr:BRO family protein [Seinonella peptonophila]SHF37110.1 BRO family, N-terminal domain [Seinonella peptonophila]
MENNIIELHDGNKVKVVSEVDFEFKDIKIPSMVDENNGFWFTLPDVGEMLGISKNNRKDLLNSLERFEIADSDLIMTSSNGVEQRRKVTLISESGFYNVVLRSRKKTVKEFQLWVRCEVLPSIRKYGIAILEEKLEQLKTKDIAEVIKGIDPSVRVEYFEEHNESGACISDCKDPMGYKSASSITYKVPSKYIKEKTV